MIKLGMRACLSDYRLAKGHFFPAKKSWQAAVKNNSKYFRTKHRSDPPVRLSVPSLPLSLSGAGSASRAKAECVNTTY